MGNKNVLCACDFNVVNIILFFFQLPFIKSEKYEIRGKLNIVIKKVNVSKAIEGSVK